MIKILLILLIVLGGFGLMSHYAPQAIGMCLFHIAGFAVTGGLLCIMGLTFLGFKFVGGKH